MGVGTEEDTVWSIASRSASSPMVLDEWTEELDGATAVLRAADADEWRSCSATGTSSARRSAAAASIHPAAPKEWERSGNVNERLAELWLAQAVVAARKF